MATPGELPVPGQSMPQRLPGELGSPQAPEELEAQVRARLAHDTMKAETSLIRTKDFKPERQAPDSPQLAPLTEPEKEHYRVTTKKTFTSTFTMTEHLSIFEELLERFVPFKFHPYLRNYFMKEMKKKDFDQQTQKRGKRPSLQR